MTFVIHCLYQLVFKHFYLFPNCISTINCMALKLLYHLYVYEVCKLSNENNSVKHFTYNHTISRLYLLQNLLWQYSKIHDTLPVTTFFRKSKLFSIHPKILWHTSILSLCSIVRFFDINFKQTFLISESFVKI